MVYLKFGYCRAEGAKKMPVLRKIGKQALPPPGKPMFMGSPTRIIVNGGPRKIIGNALRTARHLVFVLRDEIHWRPVTKQRYAACFTARSDPWDYEVKKFEAEKFQAAIDLLDGVRNGGYFTQAWEIGCAEGVFTVGLARLCRHLSAVDFIPLALERARVRCQGCDNISFGEWDLNSDPAPRSFDLIVIMDVLGSLGRRRDIRRARDKIVGALAPGGYLLYGDCLGEPDRRRIQRSWWGRLLLRGPRNIRRFVAGHPVLAEVADRETAMHLMALFHKIET